MTTSDEMSITGRLRPPWQFRASASESELSGLQEGREAPQLSRGCLLGADVYCGTEGSRDAGAAQALPPLRALRKRANASVRYGHGDSCSRQPPVRRDRRGVWCAASIQAPVGPRRQHEANLPSLNLPCLKARHQRLDPYSAPP
jgi:hypothetical protein